MKNEKDTTILIFPDGWKSAVAKSLNVHRNTITNNLKKGKGETYNKIIHTAKQIYSTPNK